MSVYFVQSIDGGPIKIGCSFNVEARIEQLERHYGKPVALLATLPGGRDEERAIHSRFDHLRLGRTEQFRPDVELMAFIDRPLFVNQGDVALMEPVDATGVVLKAVRLELPEPKHRELRIEAAKEGVSMSSFVRRLVEEYLRTSKGRGPK